MAISLLFTGHMIDLPHRAVPRFPPSLEKSVQARIANAIEHFVPVTTRGSLPSQVIFTLGFASCARGGDILFHEECRRRGIDTVIVLPFEPHEFIKFSVEGVPEGNWPTRFWQLWNSTGAERRHVLGFSVSDEAYTICNTRLLELAHRYGRVHLIALWDGKGGDGPGGTADLIEKIKTEGESYIFSPQSLQT